MQITFDPTDPAVKQMLSEWADGGKYYVTLNVTQVDGASGTFDVDEVVDYGQAEPAPTEDTIEEATPAEPAPTEAAMPKAAEMAMEQMMAKR